MAQSIIMIIGAGKVGSALGCYLEPFFGKENIRYHDPEKEMNGNFENVNVIHITVPYLEMDQWLEMWKRVQNRIITHPIIIIHSTINPLLLEQIKTCPDPCYYIPIRCKETEMEKEIGLLEWLIAPINTDSNRIYDYVGNQLNLEYSQFKDPFALAYGKLMETTWFGMNIAFCQMMKRVCDEHHWNFDEAYSYYTALSRVKHDYRFETSYYDPRPVFVPNKIGGTCVMQNLKIVDDNNLADLNFIEFILDSNDKVQKND